MSAWSSPLLRPRAPNLCFLYHVVFVPRSSCALTFHRPIACPPLTHAYFCPTSYLLSPPAFLYCYFYSGAMYFFTAIPTLPLLPFSMPSRFPGPHSPPLVPLSCSPSAFLSVCTMFLRCFRTVFARTLGKRRTSRSGACAACTADDTRLPFWTPRHFLRFCLDCAFHCPLLQCPSQGAPLSRTLEFTPVVTFPHSPPDLRHLAPTCLPPRFILPLVRVFHSWLFRGFQIGSHTLRALRLSLTSLSAALLPLPILPSHRLRYFASFRMASGGHRAFSPCALTFAASIFRAGFTRFSSDLLLTSPSLHPLMLLTRLYSPPTPLSTSIRRPLLTTLLSFAFFPPVPLLGFLAASLSSYRVPHMFPLFFSLPLLFTSGWGLSRPFFLLFSLLLSYYISSVLICLSRCFIFHTPTPLMSLPLLSPILISPFLF